MTNRVRTHCRCCSAVCGILVETEGERVVAVRGDPADPRSRGYICPKGASLPAFHHRDDALMAPRLRGTAVDWQTCLDDLGGRLAALRAAHGAEAIAAHQGTGAVLDSLGVTTLGGLVAGIGTPQFYTAATVDVAPLFRAAELVTGAWYLNPVWVPEDPDGRLALFLGFNPAVSHGYLTILPDPVRRLRAFRARGGRIWAVDPRATRTAALADRHLAIRPGSDAFLLAFLARELTAAGGDGEDFRRMTTAEDRAALAAALAPFTRARAAAATGLAEADLEALLAAVRAAGRLAIVAGTGITFGPDALLTEWLRWVVLIATGSLDRPGGMGFDRGWLYPLDRRPVWRHPPPEGEAGPGPRSRPELAQRFGQYPLAALVDEIEAGTVRALIVAGASPLTALPDSDRTRRALARLEVLAVLDVVDTPLTALATHVLAAAGQLERDDILVETRTMLAPAAVRPMGQRRPMWWILGEIGRRLGLDLTQGAAPDRAGTEALLRRLAAGGRDGADALFAAGPDGLAPPAERGWVRAHALPDGRWRLVPPGLPDRLAMLASRRAAPESLVLTNARQIGRVNATTYVPPGKSRERATLHLHPADAAARGLAEGSRARLASRHGAISAAVRLDPALRPGSVALPGGWFEANAAALVGRQADPMTGQPAMNGFAVTVEAEG